MEINMQNPKDFIFSIDFATTKQLLDNDGEPVILTGTITLNSASNESYIDFTVPNKQLVSRILMKPSTINKWFVGTVDLSASDRSWITNTSVHKTTSTALRLQWTSRFGGHPTMSIQYKIYLFLSPFDTN